MCAREAQSQCRGCQRRQRKVYSRVRGKANKLFAELQQKCVAKRKDGGGDGGDDEAKRPSAKTRRKIGLRIKKACAETEDKQQCKDRVKAKIREAFKAKNPDAEVEVSVTDDGDANTGGSRRLNTDAALTAEVTVTQTGAQANPDYEASITSALGSAEVEVTSDATEATESITAPSQLPDITEIAGDFDDNTDAVTTGTLRKASSVGRAALGAAATAVVALVSFLI